MRPLISVKAGLISQFRRAVILLGILFFFFAAYAPALSAEEVVRIGGTGSNLGAMKIMAKAFERSHPGIKVKVLPSLGSGGGIKAVAGGAIEIGLIIRRLTDEELKLGLALIHYARTPFVFAAGKDVRVENMTTAEIIQILDGTKSAWPDGRRIRLVLRPPSDYEMTILRTVSPAVSGALDNALARKGMLTALTAQDCADLLATTPGSMGFTNLALILSEKRPLKILSYNGVDPSARNLASGKYPIAHDLYFVIKPPASGAAAEFIRFVQSPAGRKVLEETGHVAVPEKQ